MSTRPIIEESWETAGRPSPETRQRRLRDEGNPEPTYQTVSPARNAGKRSIQRGHETMIERQMRNFRHFLRASEAVSALEYALLVGIITVAIGAAV
ncbi:MAG: hypothetical protein J4F33_13305, partial [Alphaproteobacteria bacterium]|nr:hypothetical protein [Alphaproteobacteria bacterium]